MDTGHTCVQKLTRDGKVAPWISLPWASFYPSKFPPNPMRHLQQQIQSRTSCCGSANIVHYEADRGNCRRLRTCVKMGGTGWGDWEISATFVHARSCPPFLAQALLHSFPGTYSSKIAGICLKVTHWPLSSLLGGMYKIFLLTCYWLSVAFPHHCILHCQCSTMAEDGGG